MDIDAIAAASIELHLGQTQQAVDVALLKKAMDAQQDQAAQLLETVRQPVSFGHKLDVRV